MGSLPGWLSLIHGSDGLAVNCVSFLFGLKYAPEIWAVVDVCEMRVGTSVGICDRHCLTWRS
jgi:hypothetical protein